MTEEQKETTTKKPTKKEKLLVEKILRGVQFLFIALSLGTLAKHSTTITWAEPLIDYGIVAMTIILVIMVRQIKKVRVKNEVKK